MKKQPKLLKTKSSTRHCLKKTIFVILPLKCVMCLYVSVSLLGIFTIVIRSCNVYYVKFAVGYLTQEWVYKRQYLIISILNCNVNDSTIYCFVCRYIFRYYLLPTKNQLCLIHNVFVIDVNSLVVSSNCVYVEFGPIHILKTASFQKVTMIKLVFLYLKPCV